jgi:hypothetical protein
VIKYWLEIKLQYKNERAGLEEKWGNQQENKDDAYLPFCDTSKTNAENLIMLINIEFRYAIPMC